MFFLSILLIIFSSSIRTMEMGVYDLFTNNKGVIKDLKLNRFWKKTNEEERSKILSLFERSLVFANFQRDELVNKPLNRKVGFSRSDFLYELGKKAMRENEYELSEKLIVNALKYEKNTVKRHDIANALIDFYYKKRHDVSGSIKKCEHLCLQNIELIRRKKIKENTESFKRLAIIYEDKQKYNEAIGISKMALKLGLNDGTKSGFEGRIEKLESKTKKAL